MRPEPVSGHQDLQQGILALLGSCRPAWGDLLMRRYSPLLLLVLAGCSQTPQSSSLPEPYIVFAEQDGYTLYESYQLVESQVQRLSSEGGELQLKEVKQVDPVPDGRLYLKDPEGKVKLLTTHENFGPAFFAESGAFSPDMQTVYTVAVKNQSQEGIYAIDLKSLNASLILSSSEMGFELIEGTILEASRSGELGFKAYQAQEVPIAREGNPEGTPIRLQGDSYTLELQGNKAGNLRKGQRRDLEPDYRIIQNLAGVKARDERDFYLEMPFYNELTGEVDISCGYNCEFHKDVTTGPAQYHDLYAVDFNLPGNTDYNEVMYASAAGAVYLADTCPAGMYGRKIVLKHAMNYWTLYAHLRSLDSSILPEGTDPDGTSGCTDPAPPVPNAELITVSSGKPIGKVGCSGIPGVTCNEATGVINNVHLHFVVRFGPDFNHADSIRPLIMNGVGPYMTSGRPILPVYPKDDPFRPGPVYPYGDIPRPDGNRPNDPDPARPGPGDDWNGHRAVVPCTPIVEFFQDARTCEDGVSPADCNALINKAVATPDWDDRHYMRIGSFYALRANCKLAALVIGKPNYPPYPPELGFPIDPSDNKIGTWIEHQSCQIYGEEGKPPLIMRPPSQCIPPE